MQPDEPLKFPNRRPVPYKHEVDALLAEGRNPDVVVYLGRGAHERAERRRLDFGPGTALVLPADEAVESFTWPPLEPVATVSDMPDPDTSRRILAAVAAACARTVRDQ